MAEHPERLLRDQARAKHRAFEVWLDAWFSCRSKLLTTSVGEVLRMSKGYMNKRNIAELFILLEQSVPSPAGENWKGAYQHLAWLQRIFCSSLCGCLIHSVNRLTNDRFSSSECAGLSPRFTQKRPSARRSAERP